MREVITWSLAFTANFALAFVNAFGNHAPVLATGNVQLVPA